MNIVMMKLRPILGQKDLVVRSCHKPLVIIHQLLLLLFQAMPFICKNWLIAELMVFFIYIIKYIIIININVLFI